MTLDEQLRRVVDDVTFTSAERKAALERLVAEHGPDAVREAVKRWGRAKRGLFDDDTTNQ